MQTRYSLSPVASEMRRLQVLQAQLVHHRSALSPPPRVDHPTSSTEVAFCPTLTFAETRLGSIQHSTWIRRAHTWTRLALHGKTWSLRKRFGLDASTNSLLVHSRIPNVARRASSSRRCRRCRNSIVWDSVFGLAMREACTRPCDCIYCVIFARVLCRC